MYLLLKFWNRLSQCSLVKIYFCFGKSAKDILMLAVNLIVNSLDIGKSVCAAFLDLKKAFDSLDHCILLQ